jgi:hypothetical protein
MVPKGATGRIFQDTEVNFPSKLKGFYPCLLIHGSIGLTVTPPRELAAMKNLFSTLLNDLANRVRVFRMHNSVHNHVTNSALT